MGNAILYTASMSGRLLDIGELIFILIIVLFRKPIAKLFSQYIDFEQFAKIVSIKKNSTFIFRLMEITLVIMIIILTPAVIQEYQEIYCVYKEGQYEIVEGTVESFSTTKTKEEFTLAGVHFAYNERENNVGYHKVLAHGGVINGDGQKIKIGYVPYNGENRIVLIEEIR